ncbi:MAG TPA: MBL fold metallo-hydrolase [Pseudomonas sp.]|jgi:glyoxylase-like metal-dependent hydrolase (beta-lactamase superfamily II)|uniref:MBL fold metallo-hydrolase n=1 Tax=Stutzerimonas stutzeri group TaxID=136846 RepID=UPI0007B8B0A3|nr:MBL fold metallo-hydrolase [Stutzerimonas frequens]MAL90529.1 MBL fold metallo-hydrolase [Pseudomonas sp.]RRV69752.1 MBL fold metallo-hydrolase [Stutzerimonas stutzeri]KZX64553.1 MBL fold metallo-hydrolase [Stutzerimonas frequens]MDA0425543.1 MBL fold metallo-hydrolase [Stutzerimonas frequens]MDL0440164.1 MBL fold metallo-hydrolase [Stutzerimonas frequens]|tara:strand:- start:558 stop:1421 length:864 start_codon:yes stop_codon:yes gene_type:complete
MNAHVEPFFDPATFTYSYVVSDPETRQCAVIDSVLDYDPASGRTSHATAQRLVDYVREQDLKVQWLLETHVHADHLSAAPYLKQQLGGCMAIGDRITVVQNTFGKLFNAGTEFATDGRQFDHLFQDEETFQVGNVPARAIHTPGHTPACMTYVIGDAAFVGDTLFMPDYGTARCDFPGGDARTLYRSIQKLFALPGETRVFMCHDYKAPGRDEFLYETTIAAEREHNVHVHSGISEQQFVDMRTARDATLAMPTLILPSVQINMRGGELPAPESNGTRYLKIPLDVL